MGKLYHGSACEIIKSSDGWFKIKSGNVTGYVKTDYIKTGLTKKEQNKYGKLTATVTTDALNVRKKADTDSKRIDVIYSGESYPVKKQLKNWVKLSITDDSLQGYVKTEYVKLTLNFKEAISIEEEIARFKAKKSTSSNSSSNKQKASSSSNINSDSVKLLACLIQAEAGNQSYEGKLAVANVVLNRVRSSKYPNSIHDVIYQKGQFGVSTSGSLSKQLNQYSSYHTTDQLLSIQAAKDALSGSNNIGSCLSFNRYSKALASQTGGIKIQDHLFW